MVNLENLIKYLETDTVNNSIELKEMRETFIENIDLYRRKMDKVYKIISKYPHSKRSFELGSYVLDLDKEAYNYYKSLIKKGILLSHKDFVYKTKEIYDIAFEIAKTTCHDIDKIEENYDKTKPLVNLFKTIDKSNYDIFMNVFNDISAWSKESLSKDILRKLYQNAKKYINIAYGMHDINIDVAEIRYSYFSLEDSFESVTDKLYSNMHDLFKIYYNNSELRSRKFTKEEKIKYYKQENIIETIPTLKEEYENYKHLRKFGPQKEKISVLEKYMDKDEFGKQKIKSITNPYKSYYLN